MAIVGVGQSKGCEFLESMKKVIILLLGTKPQLVTAVLCQSWGHEFIKLKKQTKIK